MDPTFELLVLETLSRLLARGALISTAFVSEDEKLLKKLEDYAERHASAPPQSNPVPLCPPGGTI